MKLPVFGLHVGNSTASLAIYKEDGKIDIISNEIGDRVTPAVVTVLNCEKLVGSVAKSLSFQKFDCSILQNKLLMNRSLSESVKEEACLKSRVSIDYINGELCYSIPLGDKFEKYTPAQISTLIYKKLYDIAKSAIHGGEFDEIACVILIPTYFDSVSISYTKQAVENAGWKILQMIKEPVAPILAYSLLSKNFTEKTKCPQLKVVGGLSPSNETIVLVYHLGGVSCEATVLKIFSGMVQILGTTFKYNTGGNLLIHSFTNFLAQEFYRKYKLDPSDSHKSMGKLRQAAETCMHSLSNLINADCFVESLYNGVDFKHSVSRARLEACLVPILNIYSEPIYDVLQKTGLSSDHVQKVILSGGLMKVPKLKSHISGMFVNAEVLSTFSPDEVMALGAAQQAGYILYNKHKFSQGKSVGNCPEITDVILPISSTVELTEQMIEVSIRNHCNRTVKFDRFSVIPCHELIYIDNVNTTQGEQQTFLFEIFVEGEIKQKGEVIVTPEKDVNYEIYVSITVEKKIVIKFTTKHLVLNKKETTTVHLNSVNKHIFI